jgi:hypothetical protein
MLKHSDQHGLLDSQSSLWTSNSNAGITAPVKAAVRPCVAHMPKPLLQERERS